MNPLAINKHTRRLGPPDGVSSEACGNLFIRDLPGNLGNNMWSAWEPTPDELAALNAGARVYLAIAGISHPPIIMAVGFCLTDDEMEDAHGR